MDKTFLLKAAIFVAALIVSRYLLRQIPKSLSPEQLADLSENFSGITLLRNILVYGAAITMFVVGRAAPDSLSALQPFILVMMIVGMSLVTFLSFRKFNELRFPSKARNFYIASLAAFLLGVTVLFLPIQQKFYL